MIFEQIPVDGDSNFAYLVGDEIAAKAAIIDAAYRIEMILECLGELSLALCYIISTHSHFDHAGGNAELKRLTGAPIALHKSARTGDIKLDDGDILNIGSLEMKVIHTPGHTPDCICLLIGNKLLTGDTLFVGTVGGTGLGDDARIEYNSLRRIMTLDDNIEVWPGHDYGVQPHSTIGHERTTNPFLLCPSFEAFTNLKCKRA